MKYYTSLSILLDNIEQIYIDGAIKLDREYVASIIKYRKIVTLMNDFYSAMRRNNQKDTKLDCEKLLLLLKETEFLPDAVSLGE